jgi:hypothetical protein
MCKQFSLKQLSESEVMKQYQIKILKRFAALENLNDSEDTDRAWENVKENIKISANECRSVRTETAESMFDEESSKLLEQINQAKIHWLQDLN